VLQVALDLGVFGAAALILLTALALIRGSRPAAIAGPAGGWFALAAASVVAGQVDGFFYHLLAFFTAAVALGICARPPNDASTATAPVAWRRGWPVLAGVAASILLLHTWLFYRVARAPVPGPDSLAARVWHRFPSTTLGLERWIETWERRSPDAALALSRRAMVHSSNGDFFRVQTAGLLLRRGDRDGALAELDRALAIAPTEIRPVIAGLRRQLFPSAP
jgi:hypothetical protein